MFRSRKSRRFLRNCFCDASQGAWCPGELNPLVHLAKLVRKCSKRRIIARTCSSFPRPTEVSLRLSEPRTPTRTTLIFSRQRTRREAMCFSVTTESPQCRTSLMHMPCQLLDLQILHFKRRSIDNSSWVNHFHKCKHWIELKRQINC